MAKAPKKVSLKEYARRRKVWLDALRSGKFPQTRFALEAPNPDTKKNGFCCLGVACKVLGEEVGIKRKKLGGSIYYVNAEGHKYDTALPPEMVEYLGFRTDAEYRADPQDGYMGRLAKPVYLEQTHADGSTTETTLSDLAEINDNARLPFDEIADFIEKFPARVWSKGTYKPKTKKKKGA